MTGSVPAGPRYDDLDGLLSSMSAENYNHIAGPILHHQDVFNYIKAPDNPPWSLVAPHHGGDPGRGGPPSALTTGGGSHGWIGQQAFPFTGDRRDLRSECGTAIDSGYASAGVRQSIATSSVFSDADQHFDVQSIVLSLERSAPQVRYSEPPTNQQNIALSCDMPQPGRTVGSVEFAGHPQLRCSTCGANVKNKSQLKKHDARHRKPFRCDVPKCPRTEGFSTGNDLDRHKRTVHKMMGMAETYRCPYPLCHPKQKLWPRADNFKSHLHRVHHRPKEGINEDELRNYVVRPFDPNLLTGVGTAVMPEAVGELAQLPQSVPCLSISPRPFQETGQGSPLTAAQLARVNVQTPVSTGATVPASPLSSSHSTLSLDISGPADRMVAEPAQNPETQDVPMQDAYDDGLRLFEQDPNETTESPIDDSVSSRRTFHTPNSPSASSLMNLDRSDMISPTPERSNDVQSEQARHEAHQALAQREKQSDTNAPQSQQSSMRTSLVPEAGQSPLHSHTGLSKAQCFFETLNSVTNQAGDKHVDSDEASEVKKLLQDVRLQEMVKMLGFQITKLESPPKQQVVGSIQSTSSRKQCEKCDKTFQRQCELKKHMKRHDRPYGCTFAKCRKRFGSKNDWKRHETSQHFQLEVWKCSEVSLVKATGRCGKSSHHRSPFKKHLQNAHKIPDGERLEDLLEKYRLGRNCESRFWCGFCESIVDIEKTGLDAWRERYDHIDHHLTGTVPPKRSISQWRMIDPQQSKADMSDSESDDGGNDRASRFTRRGPMPSERKVHASSSISPARRSVKRQRTEQAGEGEAHARTTSTWFCCMCSQGLCWEEATTAICLEEGCGHKRCTGCKVERVNYEDKSPKGP